MTTSGRDPHLPEQLPSPANRTHQAPAPAHDPSEAPPQRSADNPPTEPATPVPAPRTTPAPVRHGATESAPAKPDRAG